MEQRGLSFARRYGFFVSIALLVIYGAVVFRRWVFPDAFLFGVYMQVIVPALMLFIGFLLGRMRGRGLWVLSVALGAHFGLATYIVGDMDVAAAMSLFGATFVTAVVGYVIGHVASARRKTLSDSKIDWNALEC